MDAAYPGIEVAHGVENQHGPSQDNAVGEPAYSNPLARQSGQPTKMICGLRRSTFWLLAAFIVAILSAAVAAGVGGSIAASRSRQLLDLQTQLAKLQSTISSSCLPGSGSYGSCSATSSSHSSTSGSCSSCSTTFTGPAVASVSHVALDCPAIEGTRYVANKGAVFTIYCSIDLPSAANMAVLIAYSINDCMEMCAGTNELPGAQQKCAGVTFVANLSAWFTLYSGNCIMKSLAKPLTGSAFWIASAVIL